MIAHLGPYEFQTLIVLKIYQFINETGVRVNYIKKSQIFWNKYSELNLLLS